MTALINHSIPPFPCYLGSGSQGQFTTVDKATVSVLDRGFIFGDGVYEVITVYGGKPFRFEPHMARLARSLSEVRIPNPFTQPQWLALAEQFIAIESISHSVDSIRANGQKDSKNYLIGLAPFSRTVKGS
jgi:D-alanine transaminase